MDARSYAGGDLINASSTILPCTKKIAAVASQNLGDDETKLVLIFEDCKERLAMNKTNVNKLIDHCGHDTDSWIGQEVKLSKGKTLYMGRKVDCVVMEPCAAAEGDKPPQF